MSAHAGQHIIVVGNEKGGSGKSTVAIHLVAGLLAAGARVGAIDVDARQQSLTRFFVNRATWSERHKLDLALPRVVGVPPSTHESRALAEAEDRQRFDAVITELAGESDVILIDCPGADTPMARAAHTRGSLIVTPLNDSFVDFDLLAGIDPDTNEVKAPSVYAELVWDSRKRHIMETKRTIDWLVVRNRIATLETRNQRRVNEALTRLSQRIGFRLVSGLMERVVYRELFPKGMTVLDLTEGKTMSHLAARQEVRSLVAALRLPLGQVKQAAAG